MNIDLIFDPLFRLPFLTGLLLAVWLPVLGLYLRLRGEWLAVLGMAQLASAGALGGAVLGLPAVAGGASAGLLAALAKWGLKRPSDSAYAAMLLLGWSAAVAVMSNHPLAEQAAGAVFDGQLYFTGGGHLAASAAVLGIGVLVLVRAHRAMLRARVHPALGPPDAATRLAFDLVAGASVGVAILSLGVMASFALAFVPAWRVFGTAPSWRSALWRAIVIGLVAYVLGFVVALLFDQPFGPAGVVAVLLVARLAPPWRQRADRRAGALSAGGEIGKLD
ncbi:metal ABC transporter permease [Denitromonas halophila]|uniref:ABC transporter n=1 Tax=Denitromonas halophila TaxID=1629404 RepID=A0A557R1G1_9RHOO|nr:metal ABC transporter permease [Denitromonas halophila]TVO58980.1 ABC transporter [Denitromonas halophila]